MTDKPDGGPAFPTEPNTQPGFYAHHGMSYRAWVAGQALAGQCPHWHASEDTIAAAVEHAVAMADALIAELEK